MPVRDLPGRDQNQYLPLVVLGTGDDERQVLVLVVSSPPSRARPAT
jgi:hypothetical protein